jgi:ATP-dependent DNA helicase RecQ
VVAYYQQVGRAGRAVDSAFGILLSGREDDQIQDYFIRSAFPPLEVMTSVLAVLGKAGTLTLDQIGAELNFGRGAMEKALKLLEVEGAVEHDPAGYTRTANPWQPEAERYEQVTRRRYQELDEIKRYVEHPGCLMEFLARALDDPAARACGKCMNCAGHTQRRAVPSHMAQAAVDFLRHDALVLQPRRFWPSPVLGEIYQVLPEALDRYEDGRPKMVIPARLRPQPGRVLCYYGDAGWGREVARGKYESSRFSDELVAAAAELIQRTWQPAPAPEWVTAVPSQHHSQLVQDFAQRLAARLNLPFVAALRENHGKRPQKEMQNSSQQLRNVLRAFQVKAAPALDSPGAEAFAAGLAGAFQQLARRVASSLGGEATLPAAPVLLVDDMVDSGWTLTLASVLLQHHGSGPVHPFALAKASPRGG